MRAVWSGRGASPCDGRFGYLVVAAIRRFVSPRDEDREENDWVPILPPRHPFAFFASSCVGSDSAYIFGLSGVFAMVLSLLFVGAALGFTGGVVGLLGASPMKRGVRRNSSGFERVRCPICWSGTFGVTVG